MRAIGVTYDHRLVLVEIEAGEQPLGRDLHPNRGRVLVRSEGDEQVICRA